MPYEASPVHPGACAPVVTAQNALAFVTQDHVWPDFIDWCARHGAAIQADSAELLYLSRKFGISHIYMAHSSCDAVQLTRAIVASDRAGGNAPASGMQMGHSAPGSDPGTAHD